MRFGVIIFVVLIVIRGGSTADVGVGAVGVLRVDVCGMGCGGRWYAVEGVVLRKSHALMGAVGSRGALPLVRCAGR